MPPRPGVEYSTVYIQQTSTQRQELVIHIRRCVEELLAVVEGDPVWEHLVKQRLKGFNRYRTIITIITDLVNEANGKRADGRPKDFARAPIDRWNRLFKDTAYEIILEPDYDTF